MIKRTWQYLFVFVTNRDIPATNNGSERALRPCVVFRKITNGFRTEWGAKLYDDIRSVIETARRRSIGALEAIRLTLAGASWCSQHSRREVSNYPPAAILAKAFHLTPSEAKLACIIARGAPPDTAARELKISRETARNQLKSVFAKTDTHRQSELVALLLQVE